jgi:hypothetical protein
MAHTTNIAFATNMTPTVIAQCDRYGSYDKYGSTVVAQCDKYGSYDKYSSCLKIGCVNASEAYYRNFSLSVSPTTRSSLQRRNQTKLWRRTWFAGKSATPASKHVTAFQESITSKIKNKLESTITRVGGTFHLPKPVISWRHSTRFKRAWRLGRRAVGWFCTHVNVHDRVSRHGLHDQKAAQERSKEGSHAVLAMGQRPQRPCTLPRLAAHSGQHR